MNFYRKSAGVLQDVSGISTGCSEISTRCLRIGFLRMSECRKMHGWIWR